MSDRSTLAAVAGFATELDVARSIRASFADWDDVVELKPFAGTAVDASSLVAAPNLVAYPFRYRLPGEPVDASARGSRTRALPVFRAHDLS